jgi:FMN-dependent oxidoreductase (nitrilotriacetate monooxygenase family)
MTKEIRLNAFQINSPGHQSSSLWWRDDNHSDRYNTLEFWRDLSRILERGLFDGLFLADVLGVYDVYGGSADAALEHAVEVPINDPTLLIPALAAATEHLGFGVTCTLTYELPYVFARKMSTLDHLTKGRVGWNIVTGYLSSAGKGAGEGGLRAHDRRYDMADEYMEVVYRLWEGSWEDDAAIRDRTGRMFTDPKKVHKVSFEGEFFNVDAIHLSEPSPQRTPVLYQAGASGRGKKFAATHAECVFVGGPSQKIVSGIVSSLRANAREAGRAPEDVLIFTLATVIAAETDEAARAKYESYRTDVNHEAALVLLSGLTGIDFSTFALDDVLEHVQTEAMHSAVESFTSGDPDRKWTIRELAEHVSIGGRGPVFIGSPSSVADQMIDWMESTDIDGFNLAYVVAPGTYLDFVDLVVPELQRRGVYKTEYTPGTLREKLFGAGRSRLERPHPGAAFRRLA